MINKSKSSLAFLLAACTVLSACSKRLPPETLPSVTATTAPSETSIEETEATTTETEETTINVGPNSESCEATLPIEVYGDLNVYQKYLTDSDFRAINLDGVCINSLNYSNGFINDATINTLVNDWGCDVLRFSMNVEEDIGGYASNPDVKFAEACSVIDMCIANGCYVIIDWNLVSGCNPAEYEDLATDFFSRLAAIYTDVPNVIYEISSGASFASGTQEETDEETDEDEYQVSTDVWDDEIRPYSASLIESIREYDSDCVIIVQTPVQGDCLSDVANNPLEYSNIIYSISIFGEYDEVMGQELIDISEEGLPMICTDLRIYGEDNEFLEDDFTSYDELLKSEYISWCAYYIGGDASYGNMIDNSYMDAQAVADAHWPDVYITETGLFIRDVIIENALDREDYYQRRLEEETEDGDEYDDDEEDEDDTTSSTQG